MRERCRSPSCKAFKWYGARGIDVCERWHDFTLFLKDVGKRPAPGMSLERINNDGDYEPSNVRWATAAEQTANRRRANVGNRTRDTKGRFLPINL